MSTRTSKVYAGDVIRPKYGDKAEYVVEDGVHVWEDCFDDRVRIQCEPVAIDINILEGEDGKHVLVTMELPSGLSAAFREALRHLVKTKKPEAPACAAGSERGPLSDE